MKVVNVNGSRYIIQDKEDMISIVHEMAKKGYSTSQIAQTLGISEKTVIKYLGECW